MHFKFTTAGESHGKALIAIVEGVPAGLPIEIAAIDHELWRRQQGYGRGGRMKIEDDKVEITISIGTTLFRSGDTPTEAFERADKALYDAKNGGRDRIIYTA